MEEEPDRRDDTGSRAVPSSEALARRFRRGDLTAVQEVRRRVAKILAYGGLAIPRHERDDLEQEIMTQLWQAVNRTRFDLAGGFWGFVELVTSRRCIDWLRSRRENVSLPTDLKSPARGPMRRALERERAELASSVLAALAPRCRNLIEMRLRDGLSYREISEGIGKSEGALRVQFYRCIRQARMLVEKLGAEGRDGGEPEDGRT